MRTVPFWKAAIGHSTRRTRRHAARRPKSVPAAALLTLTAALIGACATSSSPAPDWSRASAAPVDGRWDDLTGALAAAQRAHEMALLHTEAPEDNVRIVTLLTNLDERVLLRAEAPRDGSPNERAAIDITVRFGLWGDAAKEEAIIQTIERSLAQQDARRRARER